MVSAPEKQQFLSYLESNYPCRVMLADEIAHDVMEPGRDCYRKLQELFAEDQVFEADGQIDRKRMAQALFSDEEKRLALNDTRTSGGKAVCLLMK